MFIELNMNMMITFFSFRRPIIIGWGRDMGTICWLIRNSIWICGWRLDRQVDPIKIGFMGSPTLRPTTCGRPVVFQPLGAPNQYRAPNIRSLWPCSNTRISSPTNTTTYQRSTHNSKRLMHNKERSLSKSKRLKHNKKRRMNNKKRLLNNKKPLMTSFVKWSWTWQHIVEHVRLILFDPITTSLLLQDLLLLLQLHLYINL
jgi:hypothetical protein